MPRSLFLVLASLSLIWGGSYYFIKILLEAFGPWTIAFLRSGLGLAVITVIMLLSRQKFGLRQIPWVAMAIMAFINTAIPWAIIGFSETRLSTSIASVLNATTPLWAVVVGLMFFKRKSSRSQVLGMAVAVTGLIILLDLNPASIVSVDLLGFICMIIASLFYAIGSHLSKRLSENLTMFQVTFGTLLCCMLGSGSVAAVMEPIHWPGLLNPAVMAAWVGLGVFGSGMAYVLFYFLVQKGGPEYATMVTYLIPVSGIVWGYTMLQEDIRWSLIAGLLLILSGVFLAGRKQAVPQGSSDNSHNESLRVPS